jgi:hypothetical protein
VQSLVQLAQIPRAASHVPVTLVTQVPEPPAQTTMNVLSGLIIVSYMPAVQTLSAVSPVLVVLGTQALVPSVV